MADPHTNIKEQENFESSSNSIKKISQEKSPTNSTSEKPIDEIKLQSYYDRAFPVEDLFQWLSKGDEVTPAKREFAFIRPDGTFIRYLSFSNASALKLAIVKKNPIRIEIGPVYSSNPSERENSLDFTALKKELVFDIDVSDYNDIRTCCGGNKICGSCWIFMSCAIKVIESSLREDFGFKNIIWTFSGRRGIHCWVSDQRAKKLSNKERSAIANYLGITRLPNVKRKAALLDPHPSVRRAHAICRPVFMKLLESQKWLESSTAVDRILSHIPNEFEKLKDLLKEEWLVRSLKESSENKFGMLEAFLDDDKNFRGAFKNLRQKLKAAVREIILVHSYPRIDAEVTKKLNHLLKSPFVVHPGTGLICVPIKTLDLKSKSKFYYKESSWLVDYFNLEAVPSLEKLYKHINEESYKEQSSFWNR